MFFHIAALLTAAVPLAVGYPQRAVAPTPPQATLLLGIAACSFSGNLLINRAFQIELAAKASAVNFSQVSRQLCLELTTLPALTRELVRWSA